MCWEPTFLRELDTQNIYNVHPCNVFQNRRSGHTNGTPKTGHWIYSSYGWSCNCMQYAWALMNLSVVRLYHTNDIFVFKIKFRLVKLTNSQQWLHANEKAACNSTDAFRNIHHTCTRAYLLLSTRHRTRDIAHRFFSEMHLIKLNNVKKIPIHLNENLLEQVLFTSFQDALAPQLIPFPAQ